MSHECNGRRSSARLCSSKRARRPFPSDPCREKSRVVRHREKVPSPRRFGIVQSRNESRDGERGRGEGQQASDRLVFRLIVSVAAPGCVREPLQCGSVVLRLWELERRSEALADSRRAPHPCPSCPDGEFSVRRGEGTSRKLALKLQVN